jgi:hypothetical protein
VTVTTNAPGLPHELVLLDGEDPAAEVSRTDIPSGAGMTGVHQIVVPPDAAPGRPTDYYLAVGVRDESTTEQFRHVIPVTTRPPDGRAGG